MYSLAWISTLAPLPVRIARICMGARTREKEPRRDGRRDSWRTSPLLLVPLFKQPRIGAFTALISASPVPSLATQPTTSELAVSERLVSTEAPKPDVDPLAHAQPGMATTRLSAHLVSTRLRPPCACSKVRAACILLVPRAVEACSLSVDDYSQPERAWEVGNGRCTRDGCNGRPRQGSQLVCSA